MTNKSVKMTVLGLAVAVASSSYAQRALESARKGGGETSGKGLERPKATELLQGNPGQAPAARNGQRGLTLKTAATNPQGAQSPNNPFSQFKQFAYIRNLKGEIPQNFAGTFNNLPSMAFSKTATPVSVSKMSAQIVNAKAFLDNLRAQVAEKKIDYISEDFLRDAELMVDNAGQAFINALKEFDAIAKTAATVNPLEDPKLEQRLRDIAVAGIFAGNQVETVLRESADIAKTNGPEALASLKGYIEKTNLLAGVVLGADLVAALGGNLGREAAEKAVKEFEDACVL
ncbi:MAG: hypothetical protein IPJ71_09915 [Bdellovibrionales bacterium]|nr:hypothetical protein [Bdellovibrionales bacterium]